MKSYYIIAESGNTKIKKVVQASTIIDAIKIFLRDFADELERSEDTILKTISFFITRV
jgi:hypothetical protein